VGEVARAGFRTALERANGGGILSRSGIRDSQFYDWKKRIREGEAAKFVEVKVKEPSEQRKPAPERYPAIGIRLKKGRSLLAEAGFDANHLRTLLSALEAEG
jgi:hypothetical protein